MTTVKINNGKTAANTGRGVRPAASTMKKFHVLVYPESTVDVIVEKATEGIEARHLLTLSELSGLGNSFIESAMDLSSKSIKRYVAADKKLNPSQSEKVLRLIQLFEKGIEIFGDKKSLSEWLSAPSFGLGSRIPLHLTTTIGGIEMITGELNRIEHGNIA